MWTPRRVCFLEYHPAYETERVTSCFIRYQVHRGRRQESFSRDSGALFSDSSVIR